MLKKLGLAGIFCCLYTVAAMGGGEVLDPHGVVLDVEAVSRMSVAQSLGVSVYRTDALINREETGIAEGRYDTQLSAGASYDRNEAPAASVFAPTRTDTTVVRGGLAKEFVTGTTLETSFTSNRTESDSSFVAVNPAYATDGRAVLNQPLLENAFGFLDRSELEKVRIDVRRFNFRTLRAIEDAVLEARRAAWRLRAAQELLMIQKQGLKEAVFFYRVTREKLTLGLLEKPDYYAARANIRSRINDVLLVANEMRDAENELKDQLSVPFEERVGMASGGDPAVPEGAFEFWAGRAIASRADHQDALLAIQSEDLAVRMTRNALWPRLDLEATLDLNGLDREFDRSTEQALDGEDLTYSFSLMMDMPLENRAERGRYRQAKYRKEKMLTELLRLERRIVKEVDAAYRAVRVARERLNNADQIVDLQRRKLSAEMRRFHQGRSGSNVVIDYQRDLRLALDGRARIESTYLQSLDTLKHAAGILLEPYESAMGPA
ncbi:MAG: TolC family protein [Candidatus Omnitrophica bacterium]|nr:TolC family protein [Candidatus Omnitrophota bacterium]